MRIPVRIVGIQSDTPEDDPIVILHECVGAVSYTHLTLPTILLV